MFIASADAAGGKRYKSQSLQSIKSPGLSLTVALFIFPIGKAHPGGRRTEALPVSTMNVNKR